MRISSCIQLSISKHNKCMLMVFAICTQLSMLLTKTKNSSSLAIPVTGRIDSLSTDYSNYVLNTILIISLNYFVHWPSSSIKMKYHSLTTQLFKKLFAPSFWSHHGSNSLVSSRFMRTVFNWTWSFIQPISSFSIDICSAKTKNLLA